VLAVTEQRLAETSEDRRTDRQRTSPASSSSSSSAAPSLTRSSPEVLRNEQEQEQEVTLAQAYSYVEESVPGRSTTLLVGLVGGIVALLLLIAREWTR
jgi:hypothetical protein